MASKAFAHLVLASSAGLALVGCKGKSDVLSSLTNPGATMSQVGSTVWHDVNCNGLQEAGEPGLGGVRVQVFNQVGGFLKEVITAPNGQYLLDPLLAPAVYRVSVDESTLPPGFTLTTANVGADDTIDSQTNPIVFELQANPDMTVDFGYCATATGAIGDRVWEDLDCDGVQDPGEPNIDGVIVALTYPNGFVRRAQTQNGAYQFTGLPDGDYMLEVDPASVPLAFGIMSPCDLGPDDALDSDCQPAMATVAGGALNATVDFGYCTSFSNLVGDRVWHDLDCDGIQDAGEPGLQNVVVQLKDAAGTVLTQSTTDANGAYALRGVPAGTYDIEVDATTLPAGFFAAACDAGNDDTIDNDCSPVTVTLAPGQQDFTVDFGYCDDFPNSVGDRVWHDLDCDGLQDAGEPGLMGVDVMLKDDQGVVLGQATTDPQGAYTFRGLQPGNYTLEVDTTTLPAGFFAAFCDVGNNDAVDNDCSPVDVTLVTTTNDVSVDFGYCDDFPNSVGDRVWHDLDCDGLQDPGEPGISGVVVVARDAQAVLLSQTVTDAQGNYTLRGLPPGTHTIEVDPGTLPAGFFPSACNVGNNDTIDNDCSPFNVTLVTTTKNSSVDFGYCDAFPNSIGNRVWHDLDCDGIQDAGEPGLVGIDLDLKDAQNVVVATTTTGAQGDYTFAGLAPGTYTVEVDVTTLPAGFFAAPCDAGGDDTADNDCSPFSVTLVTTTNDVTVDFGYCDDFPNSVGDRVWHDLDCDGLQDPGEPGLAGVRLELKDSQGVVVSQAETGAQGAYMFRGLQPGSYTVEVDPATLPAGFFAAPCNVGGNDAVDNDCSPASVTLVTTTDDTSVDFGYCDDFPNSVGDRVWRDLDCDGLQDPGEPGIMGVTVTAKDGQGVVQQLAITDGNGNYTLRGLAPGTYSIEVDPSTLPPGLFAAPCNVGGDDTIDNDCSPASVTLVTTTNATNVDFGYCDTFGNSIGDLVWNDLDCDGLQDPGEPGISGVTVFIENDQGVLIGQTVTDGQGRYLFRGLGPGTYKIEIGQSTLPPGFAHAPCMVGMNPAIDNNCTPAIVTIVSPTADLSVDFGFCSTASSGIGNFVWEDSDCDGLQDPGEPGIAGARLFVYDTSTNQLVGVARTDVNGLWNVLGLGAGTYRVVTVPPQNVNYVLSPCDVGLDDTIDSDCVPAFVTLPNNSTFDFTVDVGFCVGGF